MTVPFLVPFDDATVALAATAATTASAQVFPIREVWATADAVRSAPRVFN